MLWNPLHHMRDAWKATNSWHGKLGVVLFYFYVWYNLMDTLSNVIVPFAGYDECLKELFVDQQQDNDSAQFVTYLFRMFHLWPFGFYLYAENVGYTSANLVMIIVFTSATAGWWQKMIGEFEDDSTLECIPSDPSVWIILIG